MSRWVELSRKFQAGVGPSVPDRVITGPLYSHVFGLLKVTPDTLVNTKGTKPVPQDTEIRFLYGEHMFSG
ncbi:hypothetical protein P4O66_017489 [Electrophorus voltai]|uniref:Uncharacterized protein n=1 Tax=Electrophorus voltai TaxID=2609070 RepID=A0AAD8YTI8_9TELE|nr:hypothetical protein P4O66_017489 [Electrophorus voltai]